MMSGWHPHQAPLLPLEARQMKGTRWMHRMAPGQQTPQRKGSGLRCGGGIIPVVPTLHHRTCRAAHSLRNKGSYWGREAVLERPAAGHRPQEQLPRSSQPAENREAGLRREFHRDERL